METRPALESAETPQRALAAECPLSASMTAIGGKWNLICLYWLDQRTRRFNELRRLMPDISHKVLTATLRGLQREGLITRKVYAEVPPRVEYAISDHGESVRSIIQAVRLWGRQHLEWKHQTAESRTANIPSDSASRP